MPLSKHEFLRASLDPLFLQRIAKWSILASIGMLVVTILSLSGLIISVSTKPHIKYIYHDANGKPLELVVTSQPLFTDSEVSYWAIQRVANLYTMDYVHYAHHLNVAASDFTGKAWNTWFHSWKDPGNIDYIKEKHLLITATPKSAAKVLREGLDHGVFTWLIQFPLYLKWQNAASEVTNVLNVTIKIKRTTDPLHKTGLVIEELYAPQDKE